MTPPIIWYHEETCRTFPDGPLNWLLPKDAVPYMLARPMPIETAPEDLTRILGLVKVDGKSASIWAECRRRAKREHGWYVPNVWSTQPTHWLPMPPTPEGE